MLRDRTEWHTLHTGDEKMQVQGSVLHLQVQLCSHSRLRRFLLLEYSFTAPGAKVFSSSSKAPILINSTDRESAISIYMRRYMIEIKVILKD